MRGGHFWIRVNDVVGPYTLLKVLERGTLVPTTLWLGCRCFGNSIRKCQLEGLVRGVWSEENDMGINMMQYAYNTFFMF